MTTSGLLPLTRKRPAGPGFGHRSAICSLVQQPVPTRREGLLLLMEGGLKLDEAAEVAGLSVANALAALADAALVPAVTFEMRFGEVKE